MGQKKKSRWIFLCVLAASMAFSWLTAQHLYVHSLTNVDQVDYYDGFMGGVDILDKSYLVFVVNLESGESSYMEVLKNQNGAAYTIDNLTVLEGGEVWLIGNYMSEGENHQDLVRCNFEEERLESMVHLEDMPGYHFFSLDRYKGKPQVFATDRENNLSLYQVDGSTMSFIKILLSEAIDKRGGDLTIVNGEDGSLYGVYQDGWIYRLDGEEGIEAICELGGSREGGWNQDYQLYEECIYYENSKTGQTWQIDLTKTPYEPVPCERTCAPAKSFDEKRLIGEYFRHGRVKCGKLFLEDGRRVPAVCGEYEYVAERLEKRSLERFLFWILLSAFYMGVFAVAAAVWRVLKKRHVVIPLAAEAAALTLFLMAEVVPALNQAVLAAVQKSVEENNIRTCIKLGYESMSGYWLENIQKMCAYPKLTLENQLPYRYDFSRYKDIQAYDADSNASFSTIDGVDYRLYFQKEGEIYGVGASQYVYNIPLSSNFNACDFDALAAMERAFSQNKVVTQQYEDLEGREYSVFIPFKDSGGEYPLLLEVAMSQKENTRRVVEQETEMEKLLYLIAGVLTGSIVLVIWFSMMPLGSLKEAALKVIKGELGAEASVWGHSEAAVTAVYFNRMSRQIAAQVSGSRQYQEKYEALAPLWLFGKSGPGQNLPQVKQGWYPTMAVKTGEEKKDLNWLLEEIHGRGGEALSFDKGQVWCLFSRNVEDALEAAVEILAPLKEKPGFMASLAIDYEEIRLGVIGDESRSELAAFGAGGGRVGFLRSCGEKYGSPFLVTEAALRQLPEAEKRFHLRLLGTFWFKASSQAERVYEVLDGAGSFSCRKKLLTRANFEKGRKAFEEGDFSRARTAFVEVLQEDREDRAALHYIRLCEDRQDHAGETPYMEVY